MPDSYELRSQAQDLVKKEDGVRGLVVGNTVFQHLTFKPKFIPFSARQYLFLKHYSENLNLEEGDAKAFEVACQESGMSPETATRFLEKETTQEWLADMAEREFIKTRWTVPGKVALEYDAIYEGRKQKDKIQLHALDRIAERVWPLQSRSAATPQPKIEININPAAVEEAMRRQKTIEGEIVEESA